MVLGGTHCKNNRVPQDQTPTALLPWSLVSRAQTFLPLAASGLTPGTAGLSLAPWSHITLAGPSTGHFLSLLLSPWVTPLSFKGSAVITLNTYQPHSEKQILPT